MFLRLTNKARNDLRVFSGIIIFAAENSDNRRETSDAAEAAARWDEQLVYPFFGR